MSFAGLRPEPDASLRHRDQLMILDRMRCDTYPNANPTQAVEKRKSKFSGTFNTVRLKKYFGFTGSKKRDKFPVYPDINYYTPQYVSADAPVREFGRPIPRYPDGWMYTTVTSKTVQTVYTSMRMPPNGAYKARPAIYGWDGYAGPPTIMTYDQYASMNEQHVEPACICTETPALPWTQSKDHRRDSEHACTCDIDEHGNSTPSDKRKDELNNTQPRDKSKKKGRKKGLLGGNFRTISGHPGSAFPSQRKSILESGLTAYDLMRKGQKKEKNEGAAADDASPGKSLEKQDTLKMTLKERNKLSTPTRTSSASTTGKVVEEEWDDYTDPMEVRICGQKIRVGDNVKTQGSYDAHPATSNLDLSSRLPKHTTDTEGLSSLAKVTSNQINCATQVPQLLGISDKWQSPEKTSRTPNTLSPSFRNVNESSENRSVHSPGKYTTKILTSRPGVPGNILSSSRVGGSLDKKSENIVNNGSAVIIKIESTSEQIPAPSKSFDDKIPRSLKEKENEIIRSNSHTYPKQTTFKEHFSKSFAKDQDDTETSIATRTQQYPNIPRIHTKFTEPAKVNAPSVLRSKSTVQISNHNSSPAEPLEDYDNHEREREVKVMFITHSQSTPNIHAKLQLLSDKPNAVTITANNESNVKPILKKTTYFDTSSETDSDIYASDWNDPRRKKKRVHFKSSSESNLLELAEVPVESQATSKEPSTSDTNSNSNPVISPPQESSDEEVTNSGPTSYQMKHPRQRTPSDDDEDDDYLKPCPKTDSEEPLYANQSAINFHSDTTYDDCVSLKEAHNTRQTERTMKDTDNFMTEQQERTKAEPSPTSSLVTSNLQRCHSARAMPDSEPCQNNRTPTRSNSFRTLAAPPTPPRPNPRKLPRILDDQHHHQEASQGLDRLLREKGPSSLVPKSINDILRSSEGSEGLYDDTGTVEEEDSSGFGSHTSSVEEPSHQAFHLAKDSLRKRPTGFRMTSDPGTRSVDRMASRRKALSLHRPLTWDRANMFSSKNQDHQSKIEQQSKISKEVNGQENDEELTFLKNSTSENYKSNFEFIVNLRNRKFSIPRPPLVKTKKVSTFDDKHQYLNSLDQETINVSIYEQISEPIYEELPDYIDNQTDSLALAPPQTLPNSGSANLLSVVVDSGNASQQPRRSIFEGASRNEILSILEDAKERGVENMDVGPPITTDDEIDEEEPNDDAGTQVIPTQRNHRIRVSNISNLSDSSHSSDDSNITLEDTKGTKDRRSSVEVERNDSGVGPETSKPMRVRRQNQMTRTQSVDEGSCEDCDQPLDVKTDSSSLYEPLVCKKCGKKRTERREIVAEIVETEIKYGSDLSIIRDEFCRPMAVAYLLTADQLNSIFLNIDELIEINAKFTEKLKDAIDIAVEQGDDDYVTVSIGKLFLQSASMLHAFESYCVRQGAASTLLSNLEKDKELLRIFLRVSQMDNTLLRRMNLNSFLMVPVQRVTKYPLLLNRLSKVTPYHHQDREALREAQQKIEFHLDHINQKAKDISGTKIWRRISHISSTYNKRNLSEQDIGNIKLRKMALEILEWNSDEVRFVMEGRLQYTQISDHLWNRKNKTLKLNPVYALLVTLGKPNSNYRPDLVDEETLLFPKDTGIREATLLVAKEKSNRFSLAREPLHLQRCVICSDPEAEDMFEIQDFVNKEAFLFKAEDVRGTQEWLKQLRYHAKDLGSWRRRRNAMANIMINGMVRP